MRRLVRNMRRSTAFDARRSVLRSKVRPEPATDRGAAPIVVSATLAVLLSLAGLAGCASTVNNNVLVIGDSISIDYTPYLSPLLPKYTITHNPKNGQTSRNGVEKVDSWLGPDRWAVCTFNFGLWDTADYGEPPVDIISYRRNLAIVAGKLKRKCRKVFFVTTTQRPVNAASYESGEVEAYNRAAMGVMKAEHIEVIDLYTISAAMADLRLNPTLHNDVHYTGEGSMRLAEVIAAAIEGAGSGK